MDQQIAGSVQVPGTGTSEQTVKERHGRKILLLDPHDVVVDHGANGRFDPENTYIDDLVFGPKALNAIGQLQPIEVAKEPGQGERRYRVQVGYRRTMAARKINEMNPGGPKFLIEAIEVMPRNAEDTFARNVAENYVRKTLTPMDVANHLRRWIEIYHKDRKWCAQFYGTSDKPMSATWVDGHLALLKLEPATQRKIHNREMGWQAGRELSNLPPEEQQLIVDIIGGSGERATVDNVVKRKRQLNRLDKPRRRPKKEVVEAFETIAGSPDCPPKVKRFLDTVVEFVDGKHEVDDLVTLAWRLA